MNTIIIFDQCGESAVTFFVVDGDFSHLHEVYLNTYSEDPTLEAKQDELGALLSPLVPKTFFPYSCYVYGQTRVIVAGFIP